MRRLLCSILLILTSAYSSAQVHFRLPEVTAVPASRVIVPVVLDGAEAVSALQFTVEYDPRILAPSDRLAAPGDRLSDHSIGATQAPGRLTVVIASTSLALVDPRPGVAANLFFDVNPDAAVGDETPMRIDSILVSNAFAEQLSVVVEEGLVRVGLEGSGPVDFQNELVFPHVANGEFTGGRVRVSLILVNRERATASVRLSFFRDDGQMFEVSPVNGVQDSKFELTVPAGGSLVFQTDGLGSLQSGYAQVLSTSPLGGVLLFSTATDSGSTVAETGVGVSPPLKNFSIPVLFEQGFVDTGIALANANSQLGLVTLSLVTPSGETLASSDLELAAGHRVAQFASEFFEELGSMTEFQGSILVEASVPVSGLALQQKVPLLTTFPVIPVP